MKSDNNKIIIYEGDGKARVEVRLSNESIWLTQKQIAELFDIDRSVITKHLNNIFRSAELEENSVCAVFAHTAEDEKVYQTKFYNLEAAISVGYRVNSKKATAFRIWATKMLKQYLTKGFAVNERKFSEVQKIIQFITAKAKAKELTGSEKEILDVIERYSKTWKILGEYDEGKIEIAGEKRAKYTLNYYKSHEIVDQLRADLVDKGIAGCQFGEECNNSLEEIIENLYKTYAVENANSSLEEKAAHLLYFVIKDHPFVDGNKRIGALLFLHFLDQNNFLFKPNGETKISDRALVALALLVANSEPGEKETIMRLIVSLVQD